MKIPVFDATNNEKGKKELPVQFEEEFRPDIIKRVVIAIQNHKRQPYGAFPMAGKQSSAVISRKRRDYRGSYGMGISRVPRKILSRRGRRMVWVGAFVPGMVGGRRAHPPKADKSYDLKVNKKERRKAIRSALAATMNKEIVVSRGHLIPKTFPFIVDSSFESITKAKELYTALNTLGFEKELSRNSEKKVRAGKGKSRGRKYKMNVGMLIVVSDKCSLYNNCSNIAGVEIATVNSLNAEMLAPGTNPGRLTIFTEGAIDTLGKNLLFTENAVSQIKKEVAEKKNAKPEVNSDRKKKESFEKRKVAAPKKKIVKTAATKPAKKAEAAKETEAKAALKSE